MIREFQRDDINKVADIWLDTNIKAHNFIPAEYWKSNFKSVKEALLLAEVYVYEYDTEIQGFIGLMMNMLRAFLFLVKCNRGV